MHTGDLPNLWRVTHTHLRSALTVILAIIVVIGALVPWLGLAQAWRISGDANMFPEPGDDAPRLLIMADLIEYGLFNAAGSGTPLLAMAAALGVLVILASSSGPDGSTRASPAVVLVVSAAALTSALAALARVLLAVYAMASTPDELVGVYVSPASGPGEALSLLVPAAEVLAWSVVLLLWVAWGRRIDGSLVGDDPGNEEARQNDVAEGDSSIEEATADDLPGGGPRERVDPARLRPDGSSDSGFDEFHFRR